MGSENRVRAVFPRHVIAIDPGDVNNGFCYFTYDPQEKKADLKIMKIYDSDGLDDILKFIWGIRQAQDTSTPESKMVFVCENFRMDSKIRGAVFQWSELLTSQQIGRVKLAAKWCGAKVIMQEPKDVWPGARRWAPFPLPKGHPPDDKSAFCHGALFMMNNHMIRTVDQITFFGQETL